MCLKEGGEQVSITILQDTAASQSIILEGILPLSRTSSVSSDILVQGFGMWFVGMPQHGIHLDSDLVNGRVVVGVSPQFPIEGVSFILGNSLAGGKVLRD